MELISKTWRCPECSIIIGNDYTECSICHYTKESYVEEKKERTSLSILKFIKSQIREHKVAYSGKPKKNASGMHTINPYLDSHSYLRESSPAYINKLKKLKNSEA